MRKVLLATAVFAGMIGSVAAQDADIEAVISGQIDALQSDDFETAFTFAAPSIKRLFQTPERFGQMVVQGYPMVHRPADVEFRELGPEAGRLIQKVRILGPKGGSYLVRYSMVETENGWKINGVWVEDLPDVGV